MSILNISDYLTLGIVAKGRNPVFKVRHMYTGKEYALKKVKRTDYSEHLSDFQEILYVSACTHPNILKILGFSLSQARSQGNNEYVVNILMDLMQKDLAQEIKDRQKSNNRFQKTEMIRITTSLISALEFMQKDRKLAHRDLKPENVLLNQEGEIFLADFGDSFLRTDMRDSCKTLVGIKIVYFFLFNPFWFLGSPYYMSPELKEMYLEGDTTEDFKYDPWKSDAYALGMTLLDVACLKLGQKNSKTEKLKEISEMYGEDFTNFLEVLLEEESKKRCDFIQIVEHPAYLKLSNQKQKEERKSENEAKITSIKISEKLYNFIEKLPKISKIGKFYQILTKIKKIEEANQATKATEETKSNLNDEAEKKQKVPENYFKYFDCQ